MSAVLPFLVLLSACAGSDGVFGRACTNSGQCDIEFRCNSDNVCQRGCNSANDCRYGDACSDHQCVPERCVDTILDCSFNEFCGADGVCTVAGGDSCRPCRSEADCTGEMNHCVEGYCRVACDPDAAPECPAGFQCNLFLGEYSYYGCEGDCESYAR